MGRDLVLLDLGGPVVRRVVVVDDNQLTRVLVRDALSDAGYDVEGYDSAAEALAGLMQGEPPLACVVDQTMAGMSGAELVRSLRAAQDPRLRELPLVGISSRFGADLLAAGADVALSKPFTDGVLVEALERAVRARSTLGG